MTEQTMPTVLYIDDQVEVYRALVILLTRSNFRVLTATTADQAFDLLNNERIDLILLDIKMPDADGYEICRRIKASPHAQIPVIFMTVCNEEEEINRCFEVGGCDYVHKSINAEELRARLNTHLRLSQSVLRQSRERQILSRALNNMKDKVIVVDALGTVMFANAAAESTYEDGFTGRNLNQLSLSQEVRYGLTLMKQACDECRTITGKVHDQHLTFRVTVDPIIHDGKVEAYFISSQDITEEQEVEDSLRQAQKMASVGRIAGGVAHDLNNILGGMIGYISLLKAKTEPSNPIYSILEHIDSASERASDVITKLLEFSSVQEVNPKPVQLNDEINRLIPLLKKTIKNSLIVEFRLAKELPPVTIDPIQVKQLLINLAYAASNAGVHGGVLTISTEPSFLEKSNTQAVSLNTTFDTTNGASYSEFALAENSSLGIAIVRDIVDFYEGLFDIQHHGDSSFTFRITLPAAEIGGDELKTDVQLDRNHILVVDDELIILQMLQDCFDMLGYNGFFASSGRKGIELFEENRDKIGLVILDLVMPGLSGEEVLEELRQIDPTIKVMISSAYSVSQKSRIQERLRTEGYLSKPFKINELHDMIERIFGRN